MKTLIVSFIWVSAVYADLSEINTCHDDPASLQLPNYGKNAKCPLEIMTTSFGAPVDERDTTLLNSDLITNPFFLNLLAAINRQRVPERVVHAKGAGAFGYFEVTHDITKYCKAKMFCGIGKRTPVAVRYSRSSGDRGEADSIPDSVGFAIKAFTEEGNWDFVGFNTEIFMYKDPILFQAIGRVIKRNPVTNLRDPHMLWDLICLKPETLPFFLILFAFAVPDGFRRMKGCTIHTFQVYNKKGESYACKFCWFPVGGEKYLDLNEALKIACADPDYAVRDLFNAIARKNYPTYELKMQIVSMEEIKKNSSIDYFDVTKFWPESKYPFKPVGKIVLNRNPSNHFSDVEQLAVSPGNFPPGVRGCPDPVFLSRIFAYKDAHRYRLGTNHDRIPVNRPIRTDYTYDRDGSSPVVPSNMTDGPNYLPNSYGGPVPYKEKNRPDLIKIKQFDDSHNFDQISKIYGKFPANVRDRMVNTIVFFLANVNKELQNRVLKLLGCVSSDLQYRVSVALAAATKNCVSC